MTALTAALALAERGVPAFPCLASKAPACPGGFKAATADPASLRALWRAHPGELVGVPTGAPSGLDCVDVDPRHGGDVWLAAHRSRLPATREHVTRSRGRHLLFRAASGVRNSAGKIGSGIDVRASGGFILWWPATGLPVPVRGPIAQWPPWLLESLRPPLVRLREPDAQLFDVPSQLAAERFLTAVLLRVETAPAGGRHRRSSPPPRRGAIAWSALVAGA
jgi:hypothetical protein